MAHRGRPHGVRRNSSVEKPHRGTRECRTARHGTPHGTARRGTPHGTARRGTPHGGCSHSMVRRGTRGLHKMVHHGTRGAQPRVTCPNMEQSGRAGFLQSWK